jgi:hypothetical protein
MRLNFAAALTLGCGLLSGTAYADPISIVTNGSGITAAR